MNSFEILRNLIACLAFGSSASCADKRDAMEEVCRVEFPCPMPRMGCPTNNCPAPMDSGMVMDGSMMMPVEDCPKPMICPKPADCPKPGTLDSFPTVVEVTVIAERASGQQDIVCTNGFFTGFYNLVNTTSGDNIQATGCNYGSRAVFIVLAFPNQPQTLHISAATEYKIEDNELIVVGDSFAKRKKVEWSFKYSR